jgi:myo-inositol-1(or 4)-monophosphatase
MDDEVINFQLLRQGILATVREVLVTVGPELMLYSEFRSMGRTSKDPTDKTREIDKRALQCYVKALRENLPATKALLCSEESPGGDQLTDHLDLPDLIFIVDPVDNTDGGIHGSPAYTAITAYFKPARTVVAAAVGDFLRKEIYYADEEVNARRYALSETDEGTPLNPTGHLEPKGAYITMYTLKPGRLIEVAKAQTLLSQLGDGGRVDCIGGSASLCKVAAGYIDAAVEFVRGFQVYDLFPGAYILIKAGGECIRPDDGDPVSLSLEFENQEQLPQILKNRQRFIAAGTHSLVRRLLVALLRDIKY